MGLLKAIGGAVGGVLADQWKELFYCDSLSANVLMAKGQARVSERSSNTKKSDNIISDGSKVVVNEGQCLLVVENGKVIDFSNEAGEYFWRTGAEPSMLDSGWSGLKESFKNVGKRFTMGGEPANDQRVYYVNTKEIMDNKVGIGDVPFRDSEFSFTIMLQGYGVYSYRITDPIMFYTNVAANVTDLMLRSQIDGQLKTEVQHSLQPVLGRIAEKGISYDKLPSYVNDIRAELNTELSQDWVQKRGISIVSIALASIKPTEDSAQKISEFQESRVYTDPSMMGARLGTAQATAMESAAQNEGGAMAGFIGMGMAQQAGGANAAEFMKMGAAQNAKAYQPQWQCQCGAKNAGQYCSECGAQRPEPGWNCPKCNAVNKGQFCTECGQKRPEGAPIYKCNNCGFQPENPAQPPKFCPECGDPFDDNDKQ